MQPRKSLLSAFILTTAVAFGAAAQQTSDRDVWQAGDLVVQAHNKAMQARDAAGVAALYSEDVIFLSPDGPVSRPFRSRKDVRWNLQSPRNHGARQAR